jgi:hypothetical protein
LAQTDEDDWENVWVSFLEYNQEFNKPPLEVAELKTIFDSITQRERKSRKEKGGTQVDNCIKLIEKHGRFIHDQIGESFLVVKFGESQKIYPLDSSGFKDWLINMYYKEYKSTPTPNSITSIIGIGKQRSIENNEIHDMDIRIMKHKETILYDLNDHELR